MSDITLGLDLGPNSIGWALVDESREKLIASGVRVFPEDVNHEPNEADETKTKHRRDKRLARRQTTRRASRKKHLKKLLCGAGLLPVKDTDLHALLENDPYDLRRKALYERLQPYQIGRLLYHMNQRRGFKSNSKADRARKKETSKMLEEISDLQEKIGSAGCRTLGEYLAARRLDPHERVRGKHTRREMYEEEFDAIWNAQQKYHKGLLTPELRQKIAGTIFFQRDMYWRTATIGRCELEPGQRRCPRADRHAQRFRMLQEINNLRLLDTSTGEERRLTEAERTELIKYLSTQKTRTFKDIKKKLGLFDTCSFNLERAECSSLKGLETDAMLANKNIFGKDWWRLDDGLKDEIVAALIDEKSEYDDESLLEIAQQKWKLSLEAAERLLDINLPSGYMNFSRKAIDRLLPHLENGLVLMSNDETPSALREAGYLRPDQRAIKSYRFLPQPPDLPNPIVRQALHEVRGVVNAILREYGKPDRIHIELAREAKGSFEDRRQILIKNKEREKKRDEARKSIEEHGRKATRDTIDSYLLWKEQKETCIYSGKPISISQLLGGEVDVDHILPYSRSLDNSLMNKVICFRAANADKGDRTPYEWLAESDPDAYEKMLQRSRNLPYGTYNKQRKFLQKNVELDDFINRQLTDTAYISREVVSYVKCLDVKDVLCTRGNHTANLRRLWGLNCILNPNWEDFKNRDDHRHHAVDAIVVALTNRSRLQVLARTHGHDMEPPWGSFRADVEQAINAINVSHRVQRKIRGALHKETIYGPTNENGKFTYRKELENLTLSMVDEIRDKTIRGLVIERLKKHGIEPGRGSGSSIPAAVWKEPFLMPSGVPVKKVRLVKTDETIQPIRNGTAYVKPGSLHHLCLFKQINEKGKLVLDAVFITTLEAAQRAKRGEPIIQKTHPQNPTAQFVMSLSMNEMLILEHKGKEELCRFISAASTSKQMWFRIHTFAGKSADRRGQISKKPNTLKARKVTVDRLGRIRWAND